MQTGPSNSLCVCVILIIVDDGAHMIMLAHCVSDLVLRKYKKNAGKIEQSFKFNCIFHLSYKINLQKQFKELSLKVVQFTR